MKSSGLSIVKLHLTGIEPKITQMFRWLVIGFLAGLWLSLDEAQYHSGEGGYTMSFCYNPSSDKTCFTIFLFNNNYQEQQLFEAARSLCASTAPEAGLPSEEPMGQAHRRPRAVSSGQLHNGGTCAESYHGQSLDNCLGGVKTKYRYTCEYSGAANIYRPTHWEFVRLDDSSDKQCICMSPQCRRENDQDQDEHERNWWTCKCNSSHPIVCQKGTTGDSASTSSMTQKQTNRASDDKTTAFTSLSSSSSAAPAAAAPAAPSRGLSHRYATLLILILLAAIIFIIVVVILIIRKRKYARRYETSPLNRTDQNEAVPRGYEIMVRDNRASGDNIYTVLEVTQQPTPSNSTTYASIQPTSEVVDMGKSVDYTDIGFPLKDQQKPKSTDKGTVSVSPIYSQPFEPDTSASNTDYVEPYKPDKAPTATAPGLNHNAAADQQNVYSLAKAILSGDPNVIYSEPNKPKKSSTPTGKEVKVTDPVYLNVIEVKPGAGSEGVAAQDPSAIYAEPIKLKKAP